jgi:chromosome segregation ATPase
VKETILKRVLIRFNQLFYLWLQQGILGASTTILNHFSSALSQYAAHGHSIRDQLKAIRTREESLDDLERRRRSVLRKAEDADKKLSKMGPENKHYSMQTDTLNRLREDIRSIDSDIMAEEAALGDFKRSATKVWMGLKFGGLVECCEKGMVSNLSSLI